MTENLVSYSVFATEAFLRSMSMQSPDSCLCRGQFEPGTVDIADEEARLHPDGESPLSMGQLDLSRHRIFLENPSFI